MSNPNFSDDEIQQRAYQLHRSRGGVSGDANADWYEAIRQLKQEQLAQRRLSLFFWLRHTFVAIEKKAIEPAANWLDKLDIFRIIEKVSPIIEAIGVIAIPVVIWWFSETSREAQEQQEIAVRAQSAVQNYLNQLSDILITGELENNKDLKEIVRAMTLALLDNPDLQRNSKLDDVENFRNDRKGQAIKYLSEANLIQMETYGVDRGIGNTLAPWMSLRSEPLLSLARTNLSDANLNSADLNGANFDGANLSNAYFDNADLSGAYLNGANLSGTSLNRSDLSGAYLFNAKHWTDEQVSQAILCETILPKESKLDPNQNCPKRRSSGGVERSSKRR